MRNACSVISGKLNVKGKKEAARRLENLTLIPKYSKSTGQLRKVCKCIFPAFYILFIDQPVIP